MRTDHCHEILVVDDDPAVCNALIRVLLADGRCFVAAHGAAEAMEKMRSTVFDLIISDFNMPGMNGIDLMAHVKRHYPDTMRIMLSAYSDRDVLLAAINQGSVFRFITKPWDDANLKTVVDEALDQRQAISTRRQVQAQLEKASMETVMALAETIEFKDPYTKGHCSRVRDFSLLLADRVGLPEKMLPHLIYGSLLHDCGKIGIQETILLSQVPFTDENRRIMETHTILGFQLTNKIDHLKTASLFIRQHHERWDGGGYPDGLKEDQIHICSRIISIADAYDAMTSDRPYHKAMTAKKAMDILKANKGTQFDPGLVDAFIEALTGHKGTCLLSGKNNGSADQPPQILLVDDEINVLRALSRCLRYEGYQVVTAQSGREALETLHHLGADIIISDHRMPGMSGIEFLKKSIPICPDAIRIMLSGNTEIYTEMEAVNEAGLYKLMAKPWNDKELKHSLKSAMEWRRMVR